MQLNTLLQGITHHIVSGDQQWLQHDIQDITQDSRTAALHSVFVAMPSTNSASPVHGVDFVEAVKAQGCKLVLWQPTANRPVLNADTGDVLMVAVPDLRQCYGELARRVFAQEQHAAPLATVIAVTGTDGKTSVANMIAQLLDQGDANERCAVLGTIGNGFVDDLQSASHTTPDAIGLQRYLQDLSQQGAHWLAMEASSHALHQYRLGGTAVHTAVVTNVGRDHLDYHGSVEAYAAAKRQLFQREEVQLAVLNADDATANTWLAEFNMPSAHVVTYSANGTTEMQGAIKAASVRYVAASTIEVTQHGFVVEIDSSWGQGEMQLPLLGAFNVENALAALAVLLGHGVAFNDALQRMATVKTVTGRMEAFVAQDAPLVVVDYAHTPQAVAAALNGIRPHANAGGQAGQVIIVFGCGGDRDLGKRPLMGQAAEEGADVVIVTNDNPRTEVAEKIVQDILQGMARKPMVEFDREQAIKQALQIATPNDVVLVAGKGHETYQIIGDERLEYSDRDTVTRLLETMYA